MSLRDYTALASLALKLRRIWYGAKEISVSKLKASWEAISEFLTGKGQR